MKRNILSGFPYEVTKDGSITTIRFYPKKSNAEYPNQSEFVLKLNETDRQTLIKLLS